MTFKILRAYVWAAACVAVGLVFLLWLNSSVWLLWHLLPQGDEVRIAAESRFMPTAGFPSELASHLFMTNTVARSQTGDDVTVLVVPRLQYYFSLPNVLQEQGFRVERLGLALRAHKQNGEGAPARVVPTLPRALQKVAGTFFSARWPLNPVLLAEIKAETLPALPTGIFSIGTSYGNHVRLLTAQGAAETFVTSSSTLSLPHVDASGLTISLPSEILKELPVSLQEYWAQQLHTKLAFNATKPDIFKEARRFRQIGLYIHNEEAAIATSGNSTLFEQLARTWAQDEERQGRLERQPFRLPDGTLGYERIPGKPDQVFEMTNKGGCFAPLAGKTALWICKEGDRATLATSEKTARLLLTQEEKGLVVGIGSMHTKNILEHAGCKEPIYSAWCTLSVIRATGSEQRIILEGTFQNR